jgi:hypothetical protein
VGQFQILVETFTVGALGDVHESQKKIPSGPPVQMRFLDDVTYES